MVARGVSSRVAALVVTVVLASVLLSASPGEAVLDLSSCSLTLGGGQTRLAGPLGVGPWTSYVGLIGSWSFHPLLSAEARGSFMTADSDTMDSSPLEVIHVDFNLTYHPLPLNRIAPFVTAGVGGVRMHHTNARALNAGAGALFRLADTIHARLDARDVAYHVPGWGSSNLQNNVEIFVGFSFGLQPEASDRGGATPAPK